MLPPPDQSGGYSVGKPAGGLAQICNPRQRVSCCLGGGFYPLPLNADTHEPHDAK